MQLRVKTYFKKGQGTRYKVQKKVLFFWWTVEDFMYRETATDEVRILLRRSREEKNFKSEIISQEEIVQ